MFCFHKSAFADDFFLSAKHPPPGFVLVRSARTTGKWSSNPSLLALGSLRLNTLGLLRNRDSWHHPKWSSASFPDWASAIASWTKPYFLHLHSRRASKQNRDHADSAPHNKSAFPWYFESGFPSFRRADPRHIPCYHPLIGDIHPEQKQSVDRQLSRLDGLPVFFDLLPLRQHLTLVPFRVGRLRPMPTEPGFFQNIVIGLFGLIDHAVATFDQIH